MALSFTLYGCEIDTRFTTVSSYSSWVILDLIRCLFLDTFALHWNMLTKEERRCVRKILSTPEGISKGNRLKYLICYPLTNLLIRLLNLSRPKNEVKIKDELIFNCNFYFYNRNWSNFYFFRNWMYACLRFRVVDSAKSKNNKTEKNLENLNWRISS